MNQTISKQLLDSLKDSLRLIEMLMPGVRHLAIQDYAFLNDAPMRARQAITAAEQAEPVARDWPKIDAALLDYVAGYEMIGDNNEVCYSPTKAEQELIIDCVRGLLAESDFINLLTAQPQAVADNCIPVPAEWLQGLLLGDRQHHIELRAMLAAVPQAAAADVELRAERNEMLWKGWKQMAKQAELHMAEFAALIHYPEHWDTAAYPTVQSAVREALGCMGCSECKSIAAEGCGACGDGCPGQGCRLERESPPVATIQTLLPFFAYDSEVGFERFSTAAEAKQFVQELIDEYRHEAGEGWPEEVENLCWGMVLGTTREVELPDEYSGGNGLADDMKPVDYVLAKAIQPLAVADTTPLTDAQIERHTITAGQCPAASKVMLVGSIRRLLARGDNFMQPQAVAVLQAELDEWRKLLDPHTLHVNLCRGFPAKLTAEQLLHIAGDEKQQQVVAGAVPDGVARAVEAVAAAIYFADSSDYLSALWDTLRFLSPEIAAIAESDTRAAWERAEQARAMLAAAPQATAEDSSVVPRNVAQDAARYRLLRLGRCWSVIDGLGAGLQGEELDAAVDVALGSAAPKGGEA